MNANNTEEEKRLEADFHLVGVSSLYGAETEHKRTGSGVTRVSVRMLPHDDISLGRSMNVEFEVPAGYPSSEAGPIIVFPESMEPFRSCSIVKRCPEIVKKSMGKEELHFPWLQDAKYPLSVWFFTVRNLLKKNEGGSSAAREWATPLLLRNHFPHKRRFHRSVGSTSASQVRTCVGTGQTRGKRPYMEDTSFSFSSTRMNDAYQTISAMGVLDGHGGQECALFVADELPGIITSIARKEGGSSGSSLSRSASSKTGAGSRAKAAALPEVLFKAFVQADDEWMRSTSHSSGSTACIMLFDNGSGRAYIGNSGDTRAVVSRAGTAVDLTIDRKATDPDEIARIAIAGGHVARARVMGSLAVARAFGDVQLKKSRGFKKGAWVSGRQAVLADPEVTSFRPQRSGDKNTDDEFFIIATDGLWDVMSSQQAVDAVKAGLTAEDVEDVESASEATLSKIANTMANKAVAMGSQDNITVMIIACSGCDAGYNSDDDDCGYVSEDSVVEPADSKALRSYSNRSMASTSGVRGRNAMDRDLDSLLENIPSQFPIHANSNASSAITGSAAAKPYGASAGGYKSNSSFGGGDGGGNSNKASSNGDDDLDAFLNDDSNF